MADPRIDKLARVLVHYSLRLKKGNLVRITGPAIAAPHIAAAYREAILAGAYPVGRAAVDGLEEIYFKNASDEQLRFVSDLERMEVEKFDADLRFLGSYNTRALSGIAPDRMAKRREATRVLTNRFLERAAQGALR